MQASRTGKLAGPTLKWIFAAKRSRKVVLHRSSIELWWSSRNSEILIWSCDLAAQRALQWLHWLPASCRALQTLIRLHRSRRLPFRKKPCWDALKTDPLFHGVLKSPLFYSSQMLCRNFAIEVWQTFLDTATSTAYAWLPDWNKSSSQLKKGTCKLFVACMLQQPLWNNVSPGWFFDSRLA